MSFYNESRGSDIDPTPVVGVVGLIDDLTSVPPGPVLHDGDAIVLLGHTAPEVGGSEWAGLHDQTILMPWRLIDSPESADAVAREIARAPYRRAPRTSIYGALQFAKPLFDASGYRGHRQIIDVSGAGVNNMGPPVTQMREEVLGAGITINGLPIMLRRQTGYGMWGMAFEHLDVYYEDCVIGGPGSFVIAIRERDQFKEATRTKLVMEVAGRTPAARVVPVQAKKPRIYCS